LPPPDSESTIKLAIKFWLKYYCRSERKLTYTSARWIDLSSYEKAVHVAVKTSSYSENPGSNPGGPEYFLNF